MIEAMKQALEALENKRHEYRAYQAITALRQAIEQAEKQEPVANRSDCGHKEFMPLCQMCQAMGAQAHSYTAPPMTPEHLPQYIATDGKPMESGGGGVCSRPRKEWIGLTDDDLRQIILVSIGVAEAKLKEKNGG
jgi:hypothetical protein